LYLAQIQAIPDNRAMLNDVLAWTELFRPPLVALSLVICAAGSFTVIVCLGCAIGATARTLPLWLAAVAVSFGADVWTTHFIAMLAYDPGLPLYYGVPRTILSILIAIIGGVAPFLLIIRRPRAPTTAPIAGAGLGLTIAIMHFTGMSAVRTCGAPHTSLTVAGIAILAAMVMCTAAARLVRDPSRPFATLLATTALVMAIGALHFIAMAGYSIQLSGAFTGGSAAELDSWRASASGLPENIYWLAASIACVCGFILVAAGSAALLNRRLGALRAQQAETVSQITLHDDLTGLPNRQSLRRWLLDATSETGDPRPFALLYLNLDRFKLTNELFGHRIGDLLLVEAAQRIRRAAGAEDLVGRLGGDEFIILQRTGGPVTNATSLAKRLLQSIDRPFALDGQSLAITASIGIAGGSHDEPGFEDVLRRADSALRDAKTAGGGQYRIFDPDQDLDRRARHDIESSLSQAIDDGQLRLHYQPLFACGTGALFGFEALVRWRHPVRGTISPAAFIPFAEKSGLINKLGLWVLHTACREAATWPGALQVAVNLSPVQFRQPDLTAQIRAAIADSGLPPDRLEFELTESAMIENPERVEAVIDDLKSDGIRFAIDDFGTGYSSLSSLRRFALDRIKIDRSFVQNLESDADSAAIVTAVIGLGHALRIDVLAEGVETPTQLEALRAQGCDQVQGYLLGAPMPRETIASFIETQTTAAKHRQTLEHQRART
jgi:diguanylate cyclase (GGDEF)-like protein